MKDTAGTPMMITHVTIPKIQANIFEKITKTNQERIKSHDNQILFDKCASFNGQQ